jgi:hypothetical protein
VFHAAPLRYAAGLTLHRPATSGEGFALYIQIEFDGTKAHTLSQDGYGVPDGVRGLRPEVKVLRLCPPTPAGALRESSPGSGDAHASWLKRARAVV